MSKPNKKKTEQKKMDLNWGLSLCIRGGREAGCGKIHMKIGIRIDRRESGNEII
jgi:hypothetical protein